MKKIIFLVLAFCLVGIFSALVLHYSGKKRNDTIYIALAGPMKGSFQGDGEAMRRAVMMAIEQVQASGRLQDKHIEVLSYNEINEQDALEIAAKIINEDKVHLIIGYYNSASCLAAAPLLQNEGIPAITASAIAEEVTLNNDWYFRVIPDHRFMRDFFAYAVRDLLKSNEVSIIASQNAFDTLIAEHVEKTAKAIDLQLLNKWSINSNDKNIDQKLNDLVGELRAAQKTGTIICLLDDDEAAVKLFSSLRYPGTDYPVIGPNSFSSPSFIDLFKKYEHEQSTAGHYSNGIYAISPFISYLADQENAQSFRKKFVKKYGKEPSWVAATHYDAALMALAAIEQAELQGENIREDRVKILKSLRNFNEPDVAINGITGKLYFDENGNINHPMMLGVWREQHFMPAYFQYQQQKTETSEERTNTSQEETTAPLKVVYAGLDLNAIRDINWDLGLFTAEFYLWFRFKGDFNDKAIKFINSSGPIYLGAPVVEYSNEENGINVRAYRITGDFTFTPDTAAYPLDQQVFRISFRHLEATREKMIYVPDVGALTESVWEKNTGKTMIEEIMGWEIAEITSQQNLEEISYSNKEKTTYSVVDTEVFTHRKGRRATLVSLFIPFILSITLTYSIFWLAPEHTRYRSVILLVLLLLTQGTSLLYRYILPGQGMFQYLSYITTFLIIFSAFVSGVVHMHIQRQQMRAATLLLYQGRFSYPLVTIIGGGVLLYSYLR
jgi:branched-chain amino acid transport system substrate-binding protein